MKTILSSSLFVCLVLLFAACKKDDHPLLLKDPSFGAGLTTNTKAVVLAPVSDNDTVLTFHWPAVDYGGKVIVTYTFQLDQPSDTSGTAAWGKAKTYVFADSILSLGFTGRDLNGMLSLMGYPADSTGMLVARIISKVNQYNGSTSTVTPGYNSAAVAVTPYAITLYVPGDYQGWDPSVAPVLAPVSGRSGLNEGYYNMTGSSTLYFKYTTARDWNHTNYGDGGGGGFSIDGNAGGLSVPGGGYYELKANLNNNTWEATRTTWGIIGDATPGAWDNDTPMTYDATDSVWKVTALMKANGSFKFRANNEWVIDFGIDNNGKLVYADNPFFGYTAGLNNLTVPADGTYTIILDLHVSQHYTYQLIKN